MLICSFSNPQNLLFPTPDIARRFFIFSPFLLPFVCHFPPKFHLRSGGVGKNFHFQNLFQISNFIILELSLLHFKIYFLLLFFVSIYFCHFNDFFFPISLVWLLGTRRKVFVGFRGCVNLFFFKPPKSSPSNT